MFRCVNDAEASSSVGEGSSALLATHGRVRTVRTAVSNCPYNRSHAPESDKTNMTDSMIPVTLVQLRKWMDFGNIKSFQRQFVKLDSFA